MNNISEDNSPNAARLIESLRSVGYNNYTAIADLVDNSLDAFAGLVKIEIGLHQDDYLITISDNGVGMDFEVLDQALRLGSKTSKNGKSDLGKYGLGLITASISLSKNLKLITKKDGHYLTAIHDVDEIKRKDKFVRTIRPSTDLEKNFFVEKLGGSISGTVILLSGIERLQNSNLSIFRSTLNSHLGETFREYLTAGKKMYVNDKEVKARDPLMLSHPDTDVLSEEEHDFKLSGGIVESIKLRIVCLPKFSDAESKSYKINMQNSGFYIMRNRRQIAAGETLEGIFTKHNSLNRFRAEIFISGDLDEELGTSFTKDEIKINDAIRNWIEQATYPQIAVIRSRATKDKVKDIIKKVDHESSERVIKNRAKLLPSRPTEEIDEDAATWRDRHVEEVQFTIKQNGRLAPLFTFENLGKKTVISYNADHPFYETVFDEVGDNKDLTNAIDFLTYSISAGLTRITTEKTEEHVNNFIVTFSDNLRTLLTS
jgi:hypothetical protein